MFPALPRARAFAIALILLGPLSALADVLELSTGELIPGKTEMVDDEGVSFARTTGGSMRVTWNLVVPRCRYDLVRASLAADDAPGRVKLAKWALGAGMYRAARRDLLEAKGLAGTVQEDVDALLATVLRAEADATLDAVDALVGSGDLDAALDRLKSYLRAADPGPDATRARARVADLVQRIEKRDEDARKSEEDRMATEKAGKIKDWLDKTTKAADQLKLDAGTSAADAFTQLANGNQTRARDALSTSEQKYQAARAAYAKARKTAKDGPVAEACAERIKDCDGRTAEVLSRWGRLEVSNKNWKQASPIVDRGLKIDPVNRELLELRATIDASWIRKKMSDVSNAKGHSSSN
ncbi:MAG: hypothetical protein K8T90_10475 [Planctomycetes bacterium]|nr:hypothetical protein [Planctomycetota bacterium]